jgi:beta-lactamase regulating signal transducer with metallopeptidase domain
MTVALTAPPRVTSFDILTCLVWIWCAGVSLFTARAFGGWLVLQKLRRTAHEAIPSGLLERCRRLQQQIGITSFVRFAYSEVVDAPAVVGWFRPVVLIPLSAMSGLSTEQIEAIIAHELAHVRRYDALVNLFQIAVETVLFYHPAVWFVNRVIRAERENCCDDVAVAVCGNAGEYARALAAMSTAVPSWAMAANGGALKARVGRLLGMQKIAQGVPRAGLAALALLCASCILLAAGSFKQAPPPPPAPPAVVSDVAPPPPPAVPEAPPLIEQKRIQEKIELQERLERTQKQLKITSEMSDEHSVQQAKQLQNKILAHQKALEGYRDILAPQAELAALKENERLEQEVAAPVQEHKGPSYIDSLASVGLTNLAVDDIIALKIQGVTPEYVREMKAAGFEPTVHELIGLKVQGVTPEYIRDIRATGLKPNVHELEGMKVQGVTPEFVRAMQSAGFGDLKIHDIIGAKIQGVTPEFIQKVRAHGFKDLTFRQLVSLKMADVF